MTVEHPEAGDLAPDAEVGLDDPGLPIVLTLKINVEGTSDIRYLGDPEWAINQLRAIADQVEKETIVG